MKKTKIKLFIIIPTIILVLIIGLLLYLNIFVLHTLKFNSQGHGTMYTPGYENLLKSLGIEEDYDYIDETTGDGYCYEDTCWDTAEDEYEACIERSGEVYLSSPEQNYYKDFLTIIPAAYAITEDMGELSACETEYRNTLNTECAIRCEEEIYVWDRTPVTNLGEFAHTAFPEFTERSQILCEWLLGGVWQESANTVGCSEAWMIYCSSNSISSAGEVCETIGKTWTCDFENAVCSG